MCQIEQKNYNVPWFKNLQRLQTSLSTFKRVEFLQSTKKSSYGNPLRDLFPRIAATSFRPRMVRPTSDDFVAKRGDFVTPSCGVLRQ
jgi:hypothetical protein